MNTVSRLSRKYGLLSIVLLSLGIGSAQAVELAVGADISTLGPGASITLGIRDNLNARVGYNKASVSDTLTEDGISYAADLDLEGTSFLIDWHAFNGTFRFTAGIIANGSELTGTATPVSNVQVGNTTLTPAQVGRLNATLDFDSTAPYLGVGWGNAVASGKGFSFAADLGIMFTGSPDFELTQQGGTFTISQADLDLEEQNVENDLDDFDAYPILRIGFGYFF